MRSPTETRRKYCTTSSTSLSFYFSSWSFSFAVSHRSRFSHGRSCWLLIIARRQVRQHGCKTWSNYRATLSASSNPNSTLATLKMGPLLSEHCRHLIGDICTTGSFKFAIGVSIFAILAQSAPLLF